MLRFVAATSLIMGIVSLFDATVRTNSNNQIKFVVEDFHKNSTCHMNGFVAVAATRPRVTPIVQVV